MGEKNSQSACKSRCKGRSPVVLKQISQKSNANKDNVVTSDLHLIFMLPLDPMCIYQMKYKIYDFSAGVHLKFSKIERAVTSWRYVFSPEMCESMVQPWHTFLKGVIPVFFKSFYISN